jgi:hypothetical protein
MKAMLAVAAPVVLLLQSGESRAQPAADACALVTKAEVEAIAGKPMTAGAKPSVLPPVSADVTFSQCTWTMPDGDGPITMSVRTSKKGDGEPAFARRTAVDMGMKVEDVSGVGDVAFWTGLQLQAFRGRHVQVVIQVSGQAAPRDKAVLLAKKALARL